ncbi:hypothetical protein O181_037147 [Austropuccinia psidii MF-1]|uniref:Uncharacterized protein n=1 Tax=Austropuccinia psidii MF-1 TaxID=1389203 RepID=A0A9Q3DC35_9BASI|nr:hypothetical protein [Austropuccinia psidii MF-1]
MYAPTHPYVCASPPLTILTLQQDPQYLPPKLPPHVRPHPPLFFRTTASSSLPLTILTFPQRPQDMRPTPPSTPLTPFPTCLPSLCSRSALLQCLQHGLHSLRLRSALSLCLQCCSAYLCLCRAPPTCLQHCPQTGLILNAAYHPYALSAPSG